MQADQFRAHVRAQLGVEIGQGFVEQEGRRVPHQRPAERHALLLAPGKLPGLTLEQRLQFQYGGRLAHAPGTFRFRYAALAQWVLDIARDRHVRVQRIGLEHHGDVALRRGEFVDDRPADGDRPGGWPLQARQHTQQGGLAAAARPEDADELAVFDRQAEFVHGGDPAEPLADPIEPDAGHGQRLSP